MILPYDANLARMEFSEGTARFYSLGRVFRFPVDRITSESERIRREKWRV
jgi:hypothetical protein